METSLSSIVGSVSSEKAGLPAEEAEAYLKKGYSLNDRVGTSYLEKQYEETLQGKRSVKEIHLDKYGNMESVDTIEEGSKGNNIKLTIDLAFQDSVDALLKSYFNSELGNGGAKYSEGVYAVALNPKTGAVLSMSGLKHDLKTGDLTPDSLGTVTNVFVPGSVVKAATISSGWENGVLSGNQTLTDQPIVFQGSAPIYSWYKLAYWIFSYYSCGSLGDIHLMLTWFKPLLESWARPINQICLLEPAIWKQLWENFVGDLWRIWLGGCDRN